MVRGLSIAVGFFLVIGLLLAAFALWQTSDTRIISQHLVNEATKKANEAALSEAGSANTPLGIPGLAPAPVQTQTTTVENELNVHRESARKGLLTWVGLVTAAGLLSAAAWIVFAGARSGKVLGPESAGSARPHWFGGLLVFLLLAGAGSGYVLRAQALANIISPTAMILCLSLFVGLNAVAYHLSTVLAASTNIRPSVPFGNFFS